MSTIIASGERRTAHQLVHDTLRRAILTGQIPGRARLVQAELAEQMRVSTTPVREALRDLASEGLVELDAHRGAIVHQPTSTELNEIYRIRQLLEPEVMSRAVKRISEQQLSEAGRILRLAETDRDPAAWVELNRRFHGIFSQAADSPRLRTIVDALQNSATLYVVVALSRGTRTTDEANAQHRAILEAARVGDVAEAQRVMLIHIRTTVDSLAVWTG
ncbi:MAG: GntR family transcriptional regulator [Acidimicrobiales bacterium]